MSFRSKCAKDSRLALMELCNVRYFHVIKYWMVFFAMKWRRIDRPTELLSLIFKIVNIKKQFDHFFIWFLEKRNICYRTHQDEPVLKVSASYVKKWLTYATFLFSVYRLWKNVYNSNVYLRLLPMSHKKIKGIIGFLSLIYIW